MGQSWILSLIYLTIAYLSLISALPEPDHFHSDQYHPNDIITRDVLIVGGGSSGTYSAFSLRDKGKSVVVVEKKNILGGHTETYTDPTTHIPANIGVIVYHNFDIVQKYFARFGVPLAQIGSLARPSSYVDFRTGKIVEGYSPPNSAQAFAALTAIRAKYPYLEAGFDLPDPVPADLLLPFGDFVTKYHLEDAVPIIYLIAEGYGDILQLPTLYSLKVFSNASQQDLTKGTFVTAARGNNHEIYDKALQQLGSDALVNSTVLAIQRNLHGHNAKIVVQTPTGKKLIYAKDILITIPPLLSNLDHFDLDRHERSLFAQFTYSAYYTGLLRNSGISSSLSLTGAAKDTPYHLAPLPGLYGLDLSPIPGLRDIKYGADKPLDVAQVKADILASVRRLRATGVGNAPSNATNATVPIPSNFTNATGPDLADFAIFSSHTPFNLHVPASTIKKGFYKDLYALQGRKRFWYTGAAFHTHDSTLLWQFSAGIAERIAKA